MVNSALRARQRRFCAPNSAGVQTVQKNAAKAVDSPGALA